MVKPSLAVQRLKNALISLPKRTLSEPDLSNDDSIKSSSGAFTVENDSSGCYPSSYLALVEKELLLLKHEFECLKVKTNEALLDNEVLRKQVAENNIVALLSGGQDIINQELEASQKPSYFHDIAQDLEIAQKEIERLSSVIKQKDSEIKLLQFCGETGENSLQTNQELTHNALEEVEKRNKALSEELVQVIRELSDYKTKESQWKCEVNALQESTEDKSNEIKKLQSQVDELRSYSSRGNEYYEKLKEEIQNSNFLGCLESKFDSVKEVLEKEVKVKSKEIASLQKELTDEKNLSKTLKGRITELECLMKDSENDFKHCLDSLRVELESARNQRQIEYERALEIKRSKTRECEEIQREFNKLKLELSFTRQRLDESDSEVLAYNERILSLVNKITQLEHENSSLRLKPELEACKDLKQQQVLTKQMHEQEQRLLAMFDSMENKHLGTVEQLKMLIDAQNDIIGSLKPQCYALLDKLEEMSICYKNDKMSLMIEIEKYSSNCEALMKENDNIKKMLQKCEVMYKEALSKTENLKEGNQTLNAKVKDLKAELSCMDHDRQVLKQQVFLMKQLIPDLIETE